MSVKHIRGRETFPLPPRHGNKRSLAKGNLCHKCLNPPPAREQIQSALAKLQSIGGLIDHDLGNIDRLGRSFDQCVKILVRRGATAELEAQCQREQSASGFSRTRVAWRRILAA